MRVTNQDWIITHDKRKQEPYVMARIFLEMEYPWNVIYGVSILALLRTDYVLDHGILYFYKNLVNIHVNPMNSIPLDVVMKRNL
jgi:hypothetical protein